MCEGTSSCGSRATQPPIGRDESFDECRQPGERRVPLIGNLVEAAARPLEAPGLQFPDPLASAAVVADQAHAGEGVKVFRHGCHASRFPADLPRCLVGPEAQKGGMTQVTVGGPLHEPNLRDELRREPLHFAHLFRRDAAAPV